ncbi:MAG TPA: hypothetical protein VMR14_06115 [Streptosporangiaceae bacterium]|nr:hypothetical protein [Streptosporangiaceae bacterium]
MTQWWEACAPVSAKVRCGSAKHQLRWQAGELIATDHEDAESELVLAALGGDEPECVRLVRAWGSHSDDLDVLALGPRSAKDKVPGPEEGTTMLSSGSGLIGLGSRRAASHPMIRPGGSGSSFAAVAYSSTLTVTSGLTVSHRRARGRHGDDPATQRRTELVDLMNLGPAFQLRLSATVAASWATRPAGQHRPTLTAAIAGRLAPAAAAWLKIDPDQVHVTSPEGDGWGELTMTGGDLSAALPVGWLAGVWAPGLAVVGGRLVVAVTGGSWPVLQVRSVSQPGREPEPGTVTRRRRGWTVAA